MFSLSSLISIRDLNSSGIRIGLAHISIEKVMGSTYLSCLSRSVDDFFSESVRNGTGAVLTDHGGGVEEDSETENKGSRVWKSCSVFCSSTEFSGGSSGGDSGFIRRGGPSPSFPRGSEGRGGDLYSEGLFR